MLIKKFTPVLKSLKYLTINIAIEVIVKPIKKALDISLLPILLPKDLRKIRTLPKLLHGSY